MDEDGDPPLPIDRYRSAVCAVKLCVETLSQHNLHLVLAELELKKHYRAPEQLSLWEPPDQSLEEEEALLRAALPLWDQRVGTTRRRNG